MLDLIFMVCGFLMQGFMFLVGCCALITGPLIIREMLRDFDKEPADD